MGKIPEIKKRDDELVRRILLDVQATPMHSPGRQVYVDAVSAETVNAYLVLLQKHRLLECILVRETNGSLREALAKHVTAEGADFLKNAQRAPAWKKAVASSRTASFAAFIRTLQELALEEDEAAAGVSP